MEIAMRKILIVTVLVGCASVLIWLANNAGATQNGWDCPHDPNCATTDCVLELCPENPGGCWIDNEYDTWVCNQVGAKASCSYGIQYRCAKMYLEAVSEPLFVYCRRPARSTM